MIQLLWINKKTSSIQKEKSLIISDAPKADYFWGLPGTQITTPVGDIEVFKD